MLGGKCLGPLTKGANRSQLCRSLEEPILDPALRNMLSVPWAFYVHYRYHKFNLAWREASSSFASAGSPAILGYEYA